jgi:hypothetical protein
VDQQPGSGHAQLARAGRRTCGPLQSAPVVVLIESQDEVVTGARVEAIEIAREIRPSGR